MSLEDLTKLKQYSPSEWGAKIDYDSWTERKGTSQLFIHYGGPAVKESVYDGNINSEKALLRGYEKYHTESHGWRGLAYDWAIGQSGTLYRVRGLAQSAATSGDVDQDGYSNNREGEAVLCLIGEGQSPSAELLRTLDLLVGTLGYKEIFGHQEAKGTKTACPGGALMDHVKTVYRGEKSAPKKSSVKSAKPKSKKSDSSGDPVMSKLKVLKRGDRDSQIRRLQTLITLSRLSNLKADGIYGPQTEKAVAEYQAHFRLVIDGVCGPKTWAHLLLTEKY